MSSRRSRFRWRYEAPLAFDRPRLLIRFAGSEIDSHSGQALGIFQIAYRIANSGRLPQSDHRRLVAIRDWFNVNLAQPRRFSPWKDGWRRNSYGWQRRPIAICWFRPEATQCLKYAEAMADLLRGYHGVIHRLTCTNPGFITYEDDHQVAAVPFRDKAIT